MTQKPSKKKRIISFDLDMTLLDHKTWKIPDEAPESTGTAAERLGHCHRKRQKHGP